MEPTATPVSSGSRVKCEVCNAEAIITKSNGGELSCCDQPVTVTFSA